MGASATRCEVGEFFDAPDFVPVGTGARHGRHRKPGRGGRALARGSGRAAGRRSGACACRPSPIRAGSTSTPTSASGRPTPWPTSRRARSRAFEALGVLMTNTCINYQTILPPVRGEHLAMGDTGVVIYSQQRDGRAQQFRGRSVGAGRRADRPHAALRLSSRRAPRRNQALRASPRQPRDLADWGALGGIVGRVSQQLLGGAGHRRHRPRAQFRRAQALRRGAGELRLGRAVPHARRDARGADARRGLSAAARCRRRRTIGDAEFEAFYAGYAAKGDKVDVVVFAAPQLSLARDAEARRPARRPAGA